MWRWISVGVVGVILVAIGAVYLQLRDPRIDTSVTGDAALVELHEALSPCPRTYNSWPLERHVDETAPEIRATVWYSIESVGDVIDEQGNGTQTIGVRATPTNPNGRAPRVDAVDGGEWLPTYFEWGLREAKGTYAATTPSFYGDRPFVLSMVFELEDGRWFLPGCGGGRYLTDLLNDATERTGRTVIEFTGSNIDDFLHRTIE